MQIVASRKAGNAMLLAAERTTRSRGRPLGVRLEGAPYFMCRIEGMTERQRNAPGSTLPQEALGILNAQGNVCALCDRVLKTTTAQADGYFPHVDHYAHEAPPRDRIRGIFCPDCNRGIGELGDGDARTFRILRRLQEYLETDRGHGSHADYRRQRRRSRTRRAWRRAMTGLGPPLQMVQMLTRRSKYARRPAVPTG